MRVVLARLAHAVAARRGLDERARTCVIVCCAPQMFSGILIWRSHAWAA